MTFQRISAVAELISRYEGHKSSFDTVVVIISFDLLSELRAKCVKSIWLEENGAEYFMGCKVIMSNANMGNYLAVAYLNELEDRFHDIIEITDEETENDK